LFEESIEDHKDMTVFESLLVRNQGTTCKRSIIRLAILLATVQLSLVPLTAAQLCIQNYTFPNRVYGLAFSGQNIFAVGTNATMSQWTIGNATTLMSYSLPGYAGYAQGIATNGSHVFVGVNTSTILQFSIGNVTAPVGRFVYPGGSQVNSLVIAGDILFSGHSDGVVRQWQISNSSLVRSFSAQNNFIWQMSINDDNLFIAGGNSGLLVQWRISTASVVQSYQSNIILNAVASAGDLLFHFILTNTAFEWPDIPCYRHSMAQQVQLIHWLLPVIICLPAVRIIR
jgi:WD40 repeat protein